MTSWHAFTHLLCELREVSQADVVHNVPATKPEITGYRKPRYKLPHKMMRIACLSIRLSSQQLKKYFPLSKKEINHWNQKRFWPRFCGAVKDFQFPVFYTVTCLFSTGHVLSVNLLKPTRYVMHQQFNIQQLYVLPTLYLCVLYLSESKQRLVPLAA